MQHFNRHQLDKGPLTQLWKEAFEPIFYKNKNEPEVEKKKVDWLML